MKNFQKNNVLIFSKKDFNRIRFFLLLTTGGLFFYQLALILKPLILTGGAGQLFTTFLGFSVIFYLLLNKQNRLSKTVTFSEAFCSFIVLLMNLFLYWNYPTQFSLLTSAIGLTILASGVKGLRQNWRELTILSAITITPELLSSLADLRIPTTNFAFSMLSLLGFEVSKRENEILLPGGGVSISYACAGFSNIIGLLRVAIAIVVIFSSDFKTKLALPIVAILVGFIANGLRVSLLAVLSTKSDHQAFEYWHLGYGSHILPFLSLLIFISFSAIWFKIHYQVSLSGNQE